MIVSMVVAMSDGNVIGRDNGLPWRLSTDLRRFKALTIGKPVVMGRKCYESIGKPLPRRPNIVITRNSGFRPEGVGTAHSLDAALAMAAVEAAGLGVEEVCVIGGGEIYRNAMPVADVLHVTHVLARVEGDTFFPDIDPALWEVVSEEIVGSGEKDEYSSRYVVYRRAERHPS